MPNQTLQETLQNLVDFSVDNALANFKNCYPKEKPTLVCVNETITGIVIRTKDNGYHTINETQISRYFTNLENAQRYDLSW